MLSSLFFGQQQLRQNVAVSLPADRSSFRVTSLPKLSKGLFAEAVRREAQRDLPLEIAKIHLFWQTFSTGKEKNDVMFVGTPRDVYDPFRMALQGSKIKPRLWDLKPLALARATGRSKAIILDVEPETAELILVLDGVPRIVRALVAPSSAGPEERARAFADEIRRSVEYYHASQPNPAMPPETPVVLSGKLAGDFHFGHALRSAVSFPVEPFACPLEAASEFPAAAYAAAIGAALKKGFPTRVTKSLWTVDFNVFPEELKRKPVAPKAAIAAAAIAVAIIGIVPVYQTKQADAAELDTKRGELTGLQRKLALAKTDLKNRTAATERLAQTEAKIRAVQEERNALRPGGGEAWFDLQTAAAALPPGVTIERVNFTGEAVGIDGLAPQMESVLEFAASLERTGQFFQVSIATLSRQATQGGSARFAYNVTALRTPSPASGK
jgi:Tfp pilus assembly protein PilN